MKKFAVLIKRRGKAPVQYFAKLQNGQVSRLYAGFFFRAS